MKSKHVTIDRAVARTLIMAGACALMALVVPSALIISTRGAAAKPEFATQTGKPCGQCHVNPGGSGPLKPAGAKFKANGYK